MSFDFTYLWLVLAVVLAVLEINTTALVCLWFVIGSVFAFATGFLTKSILIQLAVFVVVSGIALAVTRPIASKVFNRRPTPTNFDMLIGKVRTVVQDIPTGGKGRVQVDGLTWLAASDIPMRRGDPAQILAIQGATLIVRPHVKVKQ